MWCDDEFDELLWWWINWINQWGYIAGCQTGKSRIHIIQFLILSQSSVFNRLRNSSSGWSWRRKTSNGSQCEEAFDLNIFKPAERSLAAVTDDRQSRSSAVTLIPECLEEPNRYGWSNIATARRLSKLPKEAGWLTDSLTHNHDPLTWLDYWLNLRQFFSLPDSRFQVLKESCHFSQSVWLHEAKEQAAWYAIYNKTQAHGQ